MNKFFFTLKIMLYFYEFYLFNLNYKLSKPYINYNLLLYT